MKIAQFRIKNFKGIVDTTINLNDEIPGSIVTLIGLNESGKTTVLEAISNFFSQDEEAESFVGTYHKKSSVNDLIPKDKKAAFTGTISVGATIAFEASDCESLRKFLLEKHSVILDVSALPTRFNVERTFKFEDSTRIDNQQLWHLQFSIKTPKQKKYHDCLHLGENRPIWVDAIIHLRSLLPRIVYFPTLLFDFPERIYLESEEDSEVNEYYKHVMQDVLDSQGEGLSIQKHIVERIKNKRDAFPTPATFLAHLFGLDEKGQIDSVTQKMSNEMSRIIFGAWSQILGRNLSDKRVQVDWLVDSEQNNAPYIQVSIIDGQSRYALSERSLGFRWFFSFLLFTQFRKTRTGGNATVFLFDEPAANLHSKAQIKLLESFQKIANSGTYIIYSTHSHYMVDPINLEKSYIIDNKAINYDDENDVDAFSIRKTEIEAIKYRKFVATHPTKTTYFQPVLDALQTPISPLEKASKALIVEGKFDYHPLVYLRERSHPKVSVGIFPANGAGDVGVLISLFRGWGVDFRVLFDGDNAGRVGKRRCIEEYLVEPDHVATLADISSSLFNKTLEAVYKDDLEKAASEFFGGAKIGKRQYSLFFQELITSQKVTRLPETEAEFAPISAWIDLQFS